MPVTAPYATYTVGDIARLCGADKDRTRYVIDSRKIEPIGRAGNIRLFDEAALKRVREELRRIDAAKREASCS